MRGVEGITDEEIIEKFKAGYFKRQICREFKVGINRVKRVLKDAET